MEKVLEFRGAEKIYHGGYLALNAFDLTIKKTDGVFTVLGAVSSGKTTMTRLIAGLEYLSAGSMFLDGTRFDTLPVKRRNVCITGGVNTIKRSKTVRRNLCRSLFLRGADKAYAYKKAEEVANMFGLPLDERVGDEFAEKVIFARPFMREADIYVFDDCAGLPNKIFDTLDGIVIITTDKPDAIAGKCAVIADYTTIQNKIC